MRSPWSFFTEWSLNLPSSYHENVGLMIFDLCESKSRNIIHGNPNFPCGAEYMAKWRMLLPLFFVIFTKILNFSTNFENLQKFQSPCSTSFCAMKYSFLADLNSSDIFFWMVNENWNKMNNIIQIWFLTTEEYSAY